MLYNLFFCGRKLENCSFLWPYTCTMYFSVTVHLCNVLYFDRTRIQHMWPSLVLYRAYTCTLRIRVRDFDNRGQNDQEPTKEKQMLNSLSNSRYIYHLHLKSANYTFREEKSKKTGDWKKLPTTFCKTFFLFFMTITFFFAPSRLLGYVLWNNFVYFFYH